MSGPAVTTETTPAPANEPVLANNLNLGTLRFADFGRSNTTSTQTPTVTTVAPGTDFSVKDSSSVGIHEPEKNSPGLIGKFWDFTKKSFKFLTFGLSSLIGRGKDKIRDSDTVEIFNGDKVEGKGDGAAAVRQALSGDMYADFFVDQKRLTKDQARYISDHGGFTCKSITSAIEDGKITAAQGSEILRVIFFGLTNDGKVATVDTPKDQKKGLGVIDLFERSESRTSQADYLAQRIATFDALEAKAKKATDPMNPPNGDKPA